MINIDIFTELLVFLINVVGITLIISIFISKVENPVKLLFSLMTGLMFIWVDFAYFARIIDDSNLALTSIKTAWIVTPILCSLIIMFTIRFIKYQNKLKKLTPFVLFLGGILGLITGFTNLIIFEITYIKGELKIIYGEAFPIYFISVFFLVVISIYILIKRLKNNKTNNKIKLRAKYMLIGIFIFFCANTIFNLGLPAFFNIVHLYEIGDYSTVIFLSIIAYAVLKHQLFGARVILNIFAITFLGAYLLTDSLLFSQNIEMRLVKILSLLLFYFPIAFTAISSNLNDIKQKNIIKKKNKALKKSKTRYEILAREQKDIIDVMGHEIRTPLTAIVQELEIHKKITFPIWNKLEKKELNNKKFQQILSLIKETLETTDKASTHTLSLVGDMLETARLEKKRFKLNYTKFDLLYVLKETIELMKKTISDNNHININFKTQLKSLHIEADKTRIREAVIALLNNSIKYYDPNKNKTKIKLSVIKEGDKVKIIVEDNGIGIEQKNTKKLGRKFVRLNPKLNGSLKRPGGTGLGLFVVKGIIAHHKGELIIESKGLHKGAKFTLIFPIKKI